MARWTVDAIRDWLYTLVGLALLVAHFVATVGRPDPIVVSILVVLSGKATLSGLADVVTKHRQRNGNGNGSR